MTTAATTDAIVARSCRILPIIGQSIGEHKQDSMYEICIDNYESGTIFSRQVVDDGSYGGQIQDMNNCLGSSAEFELALILKELRWITDQVSCYSVIHC